MLDPDHIDPRSRSAVAAPEEDATDQIGFDTPRSGVATPQPDLHDKRLPGIASYFNQVRPASFTRLLSGTVTSTAQAAPAHAPGPAKPLSQEPRHSASLPQLRGAPSGPSARCEAPNDSPTVPYYEDVGRRTEATASGGGKIHPYPTPPSSDVASLRNVEMSDSSSDTESGGVLLPGPRSSFFMGCESRASGSQWRGTSGLAVASVTESTVHAKVANVVAYPPAATLVPPAYVSSITAQIKSGASLQSSSFYLLKKLTSLSLLKSGQNTPTRSLSTAQPLRVETHEEQGKAAGEDGENGTAPAAATVAQPSAVTPAPKGRLTVKIVEARGLRKSRQPRVVALFQRSELVSGAPRDSEEEEDGAGAGAALGAIPMKRQPSDTGRAMAIPMRSRQSSNTSVTDYNTFRNRTARKSFTNPKWDAEGV